MATDYYAVLGVAKTAMRGAAPLQVLRGATAFNPLFVTAAGLPLPETGDR